MKNSAVCWKLRVSLCYSLFRSEQFSVRCSSENAGVRTISREVAESPNQAAPLTPQRLHAELLETSASGAWAISMEQHTMRRSAQSIRRSGSGNLMLDGCIVLKVVAGWTGKTFMDAIVRADPVILGLGDFRPSIGGSARVLNARGTPRLCEGLLRCRGWDSHATPSARFYLQFVQKDHGDIDELRTMLVSEGIGCGRIHNPSRQVDPDLWRFYVLASGHEAFATRVSSWHPRKRSLLDARFGFEQRG